MGYLQEGYHGTPLGCTALLPEAGPVSCSHVHRAGSPRRPASGAGAPVANDPRNSGESAPPAKELEDESNAIPLQPRSNQAPQDRNTSAANVRHTTTSRSRAVDRWLSVANDELHKRPSVQESSNKEKMAMFKQ